MYVQSQQFTQALTILHKHACGARVFSMSWRRLALVPSSSVKSACFYNFYSFIYIGYLQFECDTQYQDKWNAKVSKKCNLNLAGSSADEIPSPLRSSAEINRIWYLDLFRTDWTENQISTLINALVLLPPSDFTEKTNTQPLKAWDKN